METLKRLNTEEDQLKASGKLPTEKIEEIISQLDGKDQ
jgi:hypothetical protein